MISKRIILIALSILVIVSSLFVGCSTKVVEETTQSTTTTTTTTTTQTTTEDLNTTFKETYTNKIYQGISKDPDGSYPYKIAEYVTRYDSSNKTRTTNLKTAASKINNIKIPKGRTFSFNQTVGKRTVTAGYDTAKVMANGELTDGLGGGVCQVSSTLFQCVLRANLKIVKRTYHSLKIGYVPLGGDATVQWNSKDFCFNNDTDSDLRIKAYCENGRLTCILYSTKDIDVGDVKIKISHSGKSYTLERYVNGKRNYSTYSRYKEEKTTTKKATTKKEKTTKKANA